MKKELQDKISNPSVLVILPTYGEEEGVKLVMNELMKILDPLILVIDRPAGDRTGEIAQELGATVVTQRGEGKGAAMNEALEYLEERGLNHKYAVTIDADYTYPAEYIPKMIEVLESHPDVGMVTGRRPRGRILDIYYSGGLFLRYVHFLLNGIKMLDPLTGLRVIRFDIIKEWRPKSRGFDIESELNHFILKVKGYKVIEIPIKYRARIGNKKLRMKHGIKILKRMLLMII